MEEDDVMTENIMDALPHNDVVEEFIQSPRVDPPTPKTEPPVIDTKPSLAHLEGKSTQ